MAEDTNAEIAKALANMQLVAKLNNMQNFPGGAMGSGRVGVDIPMGESDRLSAGMNLMGMYSPQEKSIRPESADLSYQTGPNRFGVQLIKPRMGPKAMAVNYSRSF
jgi:hypothetical protein